MRVAGARHRAQHEGRDFFFCCGGLPRALPGQRPSATSPSSRGAVKPEIQELLAALEAEGYVADPAIATAVFLARAHAQAAARRGRRRRGQDRAGQGARPPAGDGADPPPVLRGARRPDRALRVGLPAPDPARCACPRAAARTRASWRRGSSAATTCSSGRCCAPSRAPDRAARAPHRRDRPRRRRLRGLPARAALRLPGHDPGAGHHPRRAPAPRRAHLEPHARAGRRAAAALPLPLHRAPEPREGGADHPHALAGGRGAAGPRGRALPAGPARRGAW